MKKSILLVCFLIMNVGSVVFADDLYFRPEKFARYNPDVDKYKFVSRYLTSLNYLKVNTQRDDDVWSIVASDIPEMEKIEALVNNIKLNNINLRTARNMLRKFRNSDNGLILQATDLFMKVCDAQIDFNNEERAWLDDLLDAKQSESSGDFDINQFLTNHQYLAGKRKESLKNILEASMFVNKILISEERDPYGEFYALGITSKERKKLLYKLDGFYGQEYEGELREGQTILEGSVAVIREILEDYNWESLDS